MQLPLLSVYYFLSALKWKLSWLTHTCRKKNPERLRNWLEKQTWSFLCQLLEKLIAEWNSKNTKLLYDLYMYIYIHTYKPYTTTQCNKHPLSGSEVSQFSSFPSSLHTEKKLRSFFQKAVFLELVFIYIFLIYIYIYFLPCKPLQPVKVCNSCDNKDFFSFFYHKIDILH